MQKLTTAVLRRANLRGWVDAAWVLGAAVFILFAVYVFFHFLIRIWPFTVDDASISFRYSENLARYGRYSFNRYGVPIEGNTSFLWPMVLTLVSLLRVDLVFASKLLGTACMLGVFTLTCQFVYRMSFGRNRAERWFWAAATIFLMASSSSCAVHAVSGMETALYTLLLMATVLTAMQTAKKRDRRRVAWFSGVALMLSLSRPEGNLVSLVCLIFILFSESDRSRRFVFAKVFCIWFILPAALYFGVRWFWFRHLFPLPFFIKVKGPAEMPGLGDVKGFFQGQLAYPLLAFFFIVGVIVSRKKLVLPIAVTVALSLFYIFTHHEMGFAARFMFPLSPFVSVFLVLGLSWAATRLGEYHRAIPPVVACVLCIYLLRVYRLPYLHYSVQSEGEILLQGKYAAGLEAAHVKLGKRLAKIQAINPVLSIADAGAVPYFSKWETVDSYGLNHIEIATTGNHDAVVVFRAKPDVVVLISTDPDNFKARIGWEEGHYKRALELGMRKVTTFEFWPSYHLWVMVNPHSPIFSQLN